MKGWDMDRRNADKLVDAVIAIFFGLFFLWALWTMILNWPLIAWVVFFIIAWLYIKYILSGF
jgi:hypothetical protein